MLQHKPGPVFQGSLVLLEREEVVPPFARMAAAVWASVRAASAVTTQGTIPYRDRALTRLFTRAYPARSVQALAA